MADLLDGLARYLHSLGLVTYDTTGTTGDLFIGTMPPEPDAAVALTRYGGERPDPRLPYDEPRVQVRVRGGPDPRVSEARAYAIYDALHGLSSVTLPDGTYLVTCEALQTPAAMGRDESGRHEHVTNYELTVLAPTTHRP
ncbi:minor capsid protein [Streptomyces sp. URMC 129]|uniref:minor capsid protein n=1 Tax=Streptomyces sp. URMC 129 TaxID=3423407 RepID=UPI003F1CE47E